MSLLFTDHQNPASDGYFRIGNVALQIPPEEMSLKLVSNKDEVMPLRSKYALQVKSGHARWDLSIHWKAIVTSSSRALNWQQWEDVRTILAMLKAAPFVEIENADARALLTKQDPSVNSIRLGFALRQLMIQTSSDIPDCLDCSLDMALFNYQPYSTDFSYVDKAGAGGDANTSPAFDNYLKAWKKENLSTPFNGGTSDGEIPPSWTDQDPKSFKVGWRQYFVQPGAPGSAPDGGLTVDHFTSKGEEDGVTLRYEKKGIDLSTDVSKCSVQQVALMFTNNLATIPLAGFQYPTMQHIGAASTLVSVSMTQKGYDNKTTPTDLSKISNMLKTLEDQYLSMRTQWR